MCVCIFFSCGELEDVVGPSFELEGAEEDSSGEKKTKQVKKLTKLRMGDDADS